MDRINRKILYTRLPIKNEQRDELISSEYNFWLFQYISRKYRIEIMQGNEFCERNGTIIKKHNMDNWNRLKEILVDFFNGFMPREKANDFFIEWIENGNCISNALPRNIFDNVKYPIRQMVTSYDAYYSNENNLFYLPLSIIEQTRIERYLSLPADLKAAAKFLADLSQTYGYYFYQYADWFPMNNLLNLFKKNHLASLENCRDLLLGRTADSSTESTIIRDAKSISKLEWINRKIQTLKQSDGNLKDGSDEELSFYEYCLPLFLKKGDLWHPLLEEFLVLSSVLLSEGSSFDDLSLKDFLPDLLAPIVLQQRNDNLSTLKENISPHLVVDRLPFPRAYRTSEEIELLRTKYEYDDVLVCLWIKPGRDDWFDGEKLARKICNEINRERKSEKQSFGHKEKIILEYPERCLVARNISDWEICTKADLVFITKINDEKYNKSLAEKSIKLLCKMHYTMYFEKPLHLSDGEDVFFQAHTCASKSFRALQIGRFLGLWAWDQIELEGKRYSATVERAIEIAKTIFGLWLDNHADSDCTSQERQMKTYIEKARLCVKAGAVLPLA